jgi:hypothetical protein
MRESLLKLLLAFLTIAGIGVVVLAIMILVQKVQTGYSLRALQENELLETSTSLRLVIMNSRNQFFSLFEQTPKFGLSVSACSYNHEDGSLAVGDKYFSRTSSGLLGFVDKPEPGFVVRLQFTAGNNRGFIVMFDTARSNTYWLTDSLTWVSNMPSSRPFLFLTEL